MLGLIIPNTDIKLEDCELVSVRRTIGGTLIIKTLPFYPPVDCTQAMKCYEFAEFAVAMITADETEDMLCTLCPKHLDELLTFQNVPMIVTH